jgi:hypothetical protein
MAAPNESLTDSRYARVTGDASARSIAVRVAALVDRAAPAAAALAGTDDLSPIPVAVYVDRAAFVAATGIPRRAAIVGLATFPDGTIHVDATGRLAAIEKIVPHEVAHVMVGRAMDGALAALPIWVNEGIAEYAAGESASQVDPVTLAAVGRGEALPMAELDRAFGEGGAAQSVAYAEAASIVNFLVRTHGEKAIAGLLAAARRNEDFGVALRETTGWSTDELETEWRQSVARRWRWPLLLQSPVLPFGLMLLVFIAAYLRYRRERRRRQEMTEDDWNSGG